VDHSRHTWPRTCRRAGGIDRASAGCRLSGTRRSRRVPGDPRPRRRERRRQEHDDQGPVWTDPRPIRARSRRSTGTRLRDRVPGSCRCCRTSRGGEPAAATPAAGPARPGPRRARARRPSDPAPARRGLHRRRARSPPTCRWRSGRSSSSCGSLATDRGADPGRADGGAARAAGGVAVGAHATAARRGLLRHLHLAPLARDRDARRPGHRVPQRSPRHHPRPDLRAEAVTTDERPYPRRHLSRRHRTAAARRQRAAGERAARRRAAGVSFDLRKGEILGIGGLAGRVSATCSSRCSARAGPPPAASPSAAARSRSADPATRSPPASASRTSPRTARPRDSCCRCPSGTI
jgi:hypothetical protein